MHSMIRVVLVGLFACVGCGDDGATVDGGRDSTIPDSTTDSATDSARLDAMADADADSAVCPPGTRDCPCGTGDACAAGLSCEGGVCREPSCVGCTKVDVLFAFDSSSSLASEIAALTTPAAFGGILGALADINCGVEYRVGVTHDNDGGFVGAGGAPWFDSTTMTATEIQEAFTTAARSVTGAGGTPIGCEHVLSSARSLLALDTTGFLRDDALLLLVLVSDVDDYGYYDQMGFGGPCDRFLCTTSPDPVATIHAQLLALKNDVPEALAALVIAGDPGETEGLNVCNQPASCCGTGSECAQAHHAPRLWELAGLMVAGNGITANLCDGEAMVPRHVESALAGPFDAACRAFDPAP